MYTQYPFSLKPSVSANLIHMLLLALLAVLTFFRCSREKEVRIDYLGQTPPGSTAALFAPGLISTDGYEHSAPAFSPDGTVVLWTVVNKSYRASMMEMTYQNGLWSAPRRPSFADSLSDDYYPSFSPDGRKLYFSSRRKMPDGYPQTPDMRIWEVERNNNRWADPVPVDTTVSAGHEYAHSIAATGTFYFSSSLGEGTSLNLRRSAKVNGTYDAPLLLPYNINSVGYEDGPYVAPDESFLIFESQRPEGTNGGIDLYISFRTEDNEWGTPVNMGPEVNSEKAERFARLSPDGKYLFFGSNRNMSDTNWGFDIYWIDAKIIEDLRKNGSSGKRIEQPLGQELMAALYSADMEASSALLKEWLKTHPSSIDATSIYSSVLRKQKQYAEAEQLLSKIPSSWKENSTIIMESALAKFGVNKDDEAVRMLAPILGEGEQLHERNLYMAKALLDMRLFDRSDEYFERAMTVSPASYPYYDRARTYARLGEKDKAFAALEKTAAFGNNSRTEFEDDPALAALKSDPRWKTFLESVK